MTRITDHESGPYDDTFAGLLIGSYPRFVYANITAQRHFEYTWDEFVGMPSRLSARADSRDARRRLMGSVLLLGYASDYRGERTARSGRRFWIEDTTIWNLVDGEGVLHGQAALSRLVPGWRAGPAQCEPDGGRETGFMPVNRAGAAGCPRRAVPVVLRRAWT
ncbi:MULTISPECIES: MEKHLA domain-containing protein [unclassified Parafrankia]|uniref:MEKHLA domain-containing protein n=1 Tax=unclassified Parafrankia TaxID=2994368 RepID=UPI000DA590DD|nr:MULTISPECIES: MEKHLA domain-containing protein [unclassified Parafrankia]TCJ36640.1 MEKHLA domain-containing protein [Parafrankia sp. BMG5.11]SQD95853.1 PAS sensor protein [Parafrankia sp. Ea1.12]